MIAPAHWPAFWRSPLTERENDGVLHGDGEVGELPDPDALMAAGWWIRADGAALYPPETTVPEGAGQPYRPEGQSR
jgi:hypothetical protein